ncbi:ATP-binding cassette domain-containing protein [Neptuniibacter marinus]|uniref:ATP-binding cassette domain-containing protein n=1 Tax=Neptuniibacter marinus TaxID=1806670 RepID=UPI0009471BF3|nr:ATP-binding cassette domain-containing protein [Neptuniibacter marinus]
MKKDAQEKSNLNLSDLISSANAQLKKSVIWAFIFSLFINLFLLAVPIYSLQVFDRVLSSQSLDTLVLLTVLIFWMIFLYLTLDWARARLISNSANLWQDKISKSIIYNSISLSKEVSTRDSHLIQLVTNIKSALSSNLITALDIPWTPLFVIILTLLHPIYGIISLCAISSLIIIGAIHYHKSKDTTQPPAPDLNILNQAPAITTLGMEKTITDKLHTVNAVHTEKQYEKNEKYTNISAFTKGTKLVAQIAIIGIGASLVLKSELTAGAMIAASMISGRALAPYESLVLNFSGWLKAIKAWKQLNTESKQLIAHLAPSTKLPTPKGNISATGLMYLYPNSQKPFLSGINLNITEGSSIAIIGSSGSGKTTLLQLLCGLKTPNLGTVRIDGATHSQWDTEALGLSTGYYDSNAHFYPGTVKENVSRFQKDSKDSSIIEACECVDMHSTILGWPMGYDTDIHKGLQPSQSEIQRLLLARAIYNKPALLFLDEVDSFLDPNGLKKLALLLQERKDSGLTTVFTTNRSELLNIPNKLIVMEKGRIIQQHDPKQLQDKAKKNKIEKAPQGTA